MNSDIVTYNVASQVDHKITKRVRNESSKIDK